MLDFNFRPATAADAPAIRALIHLVRINPLDLDWQHFILAVSPSGEMLGCGQIKIHGDGSRELASLAVWPRYQRQGIGKAIMTRLMNGAEPPLYLTCRAVMQPYYVPFGFRLLEPAEMPPYFRRIWAIFRLLKAFIPPDDHLRVMRWK